MSYLHIATVLLLMAGTTSQPPVPRPAEPSHKPQQQSTPTNRDTGDANTSSQPPTTTIYNLVNTPPSTDQRDNKSGPENQKSSKDWWNIINAGLLTLFTGALVCVTIGLWDVGRRQVDLMDAQKRLTEKVMVISNRPRVRVRNIVVPQAADFIPPFSVNRPVDMSGTIQAVNPGGTSAKLLRGTIGFVLGPIGKRLPMEPLNKDSVIRELDTDITAGGTSQLAIANTALSPSMVSALVDLTANLYVIGWIDYTDARGNVRRTAFLRMLSHKQPRRFERVEDEDNEYED